MLFVTRNASETQVDLLVARANTTVFGVIMISFVFGFATCWLALMLRRIRRGGGNSGSSSIRGVPRSARIVVDEL
jgi:hypothetical protein